MASERRISVACVFILSLCCGNSESENSRPAFRPPRLVNITAKEYIFDSNKPEELSVREITDYACGKEALCEKSQGFFIFPAPCFKCKKCRCDKNCSLFGDCCNDKTHAESNTQKYLSCHQTIDDVFLPRKQRSGILFVSRCPTNFQNKLGENVKSRCENPDKRDLDEVKPVWESTSGLTYRNKFCAVCHNVSDYVQWDLQAKCPGSKITIGAKSLAEVWDRVLNSTDCVVESLRPIHSEVRSCQLDVVSTCNATVDTSSNSIIQRLCHQLKNEVFYDFVWYKNVFCAMCNGARLDRTQRCHYTYIQVQKRLVPPLNVLISLQYPDEEAQEDPPSNTCPHGIRNPITGNCESLHCPKRYILQNQICQPLFHSSKGLGYSVRMDLRAKRSLRLRGSKNLQKSYESWLRKSLRQFKPYVLTLQISVAGRKFEEPTKYVEVTSLKVGFQFVSQSNHSQSHLEMHLRNISDNPWVFERKEEDTVFEPYHQELPLNELNQDETIINSLTKADSDAVFGKVCAITDCLKSVSYVNVQSGLHCQYVEFSVSETNFKIQNQSYAIVYQGRQLLLDRRFVRAVANTVQVCTSELKNIARELDDNQEPLWKMILTICCLSISIFFLLLTFVVFASLPKLRTLGIKNIMGLVLHLFFAQLLFLTGSGQTAHVHLCQTIGIFIHYLWLASFFWTFVSAYHMHSQFTVIRNNTPCSIKTKEERRNFFQYVILSNLSPVIIIAASIGYSLGRSGGIDIGYGGDLCFLNSVETKGIFFISPLLLVLIFNVFFYARTVSNFKRDTSLTKNQRNPSLVVAAFRLSLLLGFTWVFGFIPHDSCFVIFIIFSGGQGIFIFFAFCVNKRVWNMVRQRHKHLVESSSTSEN